MTLGQESKTGVIEMKQNGLVQRVIQAVGLDDGMVKGKLTSSEQRPLVKYANGKPPSGMFSYSIVVGIIIYRLGHSRPDISFAVN